MFNRRDFLQVAAAATTLTGFSGSLSQAIAEGAITQDGLLRFDPVGTVTLLHVTDIHAQLVPIFFREPSVNLGIGEAAGVAPHVTGDAFLKKFGIRQGSAEAYAFSSVGYAGLAAEYGRVGGLDRMATLVKAIRAERPGKTLLLEGGDSLQGSYGALKTRGGDMAAALKALGVEGCTFHWEFTYGTERVKELIEELGCPFVAGNVLDTEWDEQAFKPYEMYERGGVKIAVVGQAFPYTPVANPRYMNPTLSFGIREDLVRKHVEAARAEGAGLVVLLSHNGFDVDRKLASRVAGIDVVLSGHTHDAVPAVVPVGRTLIVASGSHGKFLSRLDLDVRGGEVKDYRFQLIPVFSDAIAPDPDMAGVVEGLRAPFKSEISRVVGRTDGLLYRRGNFNGTWDDLICRALIEERDAEISLSPGFRWGATLLPGQDITMDDIYNQTAITYPAAYRMQMSGAQIKDILEDVADNLFNPDPYYQQGGDMVRVGGLGYAIDVSKPMGQRIGALTLLRTGQAIDASASYAVAGWASVNEGTEGPPVYDLVRRFIERRQVVNIPENETVKVSGF
ncbi:thiosulfohydrolase SoxB [Skermanella sp. TT6]|uniref:Thiosulfohydrolase SoxB n=1 Tax=Skermanella cutis TaxID=2775420 RepID=A0ABX7B495_9PROT|nr:thiosulfohydrolase SoxB [Skermanella sp. TT6]QQP88954.1 thiosulfohydrolase SoxB [Skermanella sp. TT6]